MAPTLFWQSMFGLSAMASALGVGCYAVCRLVRPYQAIGLLLTIFITIFAIYNALYFQLLFVLVFPVSYLCSCIGVELHRKARPDDDIERSQGIIFTATAVTLILGFLGGVVYLNDYLIYVTAESAIRNIGAVYVTLLAVVPSLAPLLWIRNSGVRPFESQETANEIDSLS